MTERTYPNQEIGILSSSLPEGAATEATLSALAAADFATETTLAAMASGMSQTDFATQATLSALDVKIAACNTGAVVIQSQPKTEIRPDGSSLTIVTGHKTIGAPGTAEPLFGAPTFAWRVDLTAKSGNTGKVYLGAANVHKDSERGAPLLPGESYTVEGPAGSRIDLHTLFLDADVTGEGVWFNYYVVA